MENGNGIKQNRQKASLDVKIAQGRQERKESYLRQARSQVVLAKVYAKDISGMHTEKDVVKLCEQAIDYMDAYLHQDYNVTDLLTTYIKVCASAVSVILTLKNNKSFDEGIRLCDRLAGKIIQENSVEDKNEAILAIAQLMAALYIARGIPQNAIACLNLVKRMQQIQFKRRLSGITGVMIARTNLDLAAQHISMRGLEAYEKAMDHYLEALRLLIEDCYAGALRLGEAASLSHLFQRGLEAVTDSFEAAYLSDKSPFAEIHQDMRMMEKYIHSLRQQEETPNLRQCVEGLKKYCAVVDQILEKMDGQSDAIPLKAKLKECYWQLEDLLWGIGDSYEAMKYADLAQQLS